MQRTVETLEELSQVVRQGCAQLGDSDICSKAQFSTCTQVAAVWKYKLEHCEGPELQGSESTPEVIRNLFLFLNTLLE